MKERKLYIGVICILLLATTGCAFTVHQKPLNYEYSGDLSRINGQEFKNTLSVGDFNDIRDVTTPKMIMNMRNLNGYKTTGGWEAEKPIANIVKDAFIEGITKANLPLMDNGNLILNGEVVDYEGEVRQSGFSGKFEGKLTVKLQLRDSEQQKIVWRDIFIGKATVDKGDFITDGFKLCLNSLVTKVLTDDFFLQQVE